MRRFRSTLVAAGVVNLSSGKVQLTDPWKWNDVVTKPELKQQLNKFVAEAGVLFLNK